MNRNLWADRGQLLQFDGAGHQRQACCFGVSRLATARASCGRASVWIQLRGHAWVESREGRFHLRRGDWIVLAPDSRPVLQTGAHGVCLGLLLGPDLQRRGAGRLGDGAVFTGRGHAGRSDLRTFIRLWRMARSGLATQEPTAGDAEFQVLRPLLLHLALLQRELAARLARCPGRSHGRKRQVFGRLQRARLYLEGNCDRIVSLGELAELTSFSSWYFSKTFHGLYDESPQAASKRLRLERAADLLVDSPLMVTEVAAACGFDNACSFARAFRSRHGMSASSYRDRARMRTAAAAAARTVPAKPANAARKVSRAIGP